MIKFILPLFLCFQLIAEQKRIACIGDSITFGYAMKDKKVSYPGFLQDMLGKDFEVKNFGNSGLWE